MSPNLPNEHPRICFVTRGDLFPTDHGAAVKIVRTAEAISREGAVAFLVTDDRDHYWRYTGGKREKVAFPARVRAAQEWPGFASAGRWAHRICARIGYPEEETFLYAPMFDPAWWMRVLSVGLVEKVDVFQAEFPGYGVPARIAAIGMRWLGVAARNGRPGNGDTDGVHSTRPLVSIVQHNVEWDRLGEFGHRVERIRRVEQTVLDHVDHVIAVSQDDRRRMVAAGTNKERVTVVPHGVETQVFAQGNGTHIRGQYGIAQNAPVLFFHGTLHYRPNTVAVQWIVDELLPRLLLTMPDVRVLIAGQSPPTALEHPSVTFTGSVPDLANHIAAADICICPIFSGGGTRMKLLEYMAAGKPVVSTQKGAEGLAIVDGMEMVLANTAAEFAVAVSSLWSDPGRRFALGAAAARFGVRFDWSAVAKAYLSVYRGEGVGDDWNARFLESHPRDAASMAVAIDQHLPPRQLSKPRTLLLLVNRGCNLRCSFCDLWDAPKRMRFSDQIVPLLNDAAAIGVKTLVITGGEPFLHPDVFRVVRAAKARGMGVNITTNGTLVDKRWDELVGSGVDSISLSIDGLAETHDRLRGRKGAWSQTQKALERLANESAIATSVYMVVTSENVHEIGAVAELASKAGARFDLWPVNDAPELALTTEEHQRAWRLAVENLCAKDEQVARRQTYLEQAVHYHSGEVSRVRCLGLIDQIGVTVNGDLLPCCVWGEEKLYVGNVFEESLIDLWRSPKVQNFRQSLFHDGCDVGCFNHSLFEFEESTGLPFLVT